MTIGRFVGAVVVLGAVALLLLSFTGSQVNNTFSRIGSGLSEGDSFYPASAATPAASEPLKFAAGAAPESASGGSPLSDRSVPATTGESATGWGASGSTEADAGHLNTGRPALPAYQSPLTAGQVDDNAKFEEYLRYLNTYAGPPVRPVNVARRIFVRVVDSDQQPVAGARVQLFDGLRSVFDGRTMSDGRVLFFPREAGAEQAQTLKAVVERGQQRVEAALNAATLDQTVVLPVSDNTGPVNLDIVWLVDATGSMGDEIAAIKSTIGSIAARIEQLPGSTRPRFGLVAYRDRGDEYVTRSWQFADVQTFAGNLNKVWADGGGDEPESVNAGLHDAINLNGWAENSAGRHLRLVILVGDAPPQLGFANDYEYPQLLQEAVAKGIKVFPIGASGLNPQGEYIFRQFAQITQGQFVFLTYANGVSGAPGLSTDKHVTDYSVNNLDSLVINLVAGEVANQTGQKAVAVDPAPAPVQLTVPTTPVARPVTVGSLLDSLVGILTGWGTETLVVSTGVWMMLLGVLIYMGKRVSRKARVAALPGAAEADVIEDPDPAPDYDYDYVPAQPEPTPYEAASALPAGWLLTANDAAEVYEAAPPPGQLTVPLPDLSSEVARTLRR